MSTFEDFIRYAFPGYALLASMIICLLIVGIFPGDASIYKDFGGIMGALTIIIGPLVGFVVHQLYFFYFDWCESYTKTSRKCLGFISQAFLSSERKEYRELSEKSLERLTSFAWTLLTTNFIKGFEIDPLYLTRLRSVRNYTHAFGAIILSSVIAMLVGTGIFLFSDGLWTLFVGLYYVVHLFIVTLFLHKRRDVMMRVDDFELGIALLWKDQFVIAISELAELERKAGDALRAVGRQVA